MPNVSVALGPIAVAVGRDPTFDWSGLTIGWTNAAFDPATVRLVEFVSPVANDPEKFAVSLLRDEVTTADVALYGWLDDGSAQTSVAVSELADRSPAIEPAQHLVEGRPWVLVFRDEASRILEVVSIEAQASITSETDEYEVVDGAGELVAGFNLAEAPVVALSADSAIDWINLKFGSDGAAFDAGRVGRLRVAPLSDELRVTAAPWAQLDAALNTGESTDVGAATKMELPPMLASAAPGDRFLVSLDCNACEPVLPGAVFVAERE